MGSVVEPHHRAAIERASARHREDPEVRALLLGGSIAHGFARPDSDVDLLIVVSDEEHARRRDAGRLHDWSAEGCDWTGGYVEGKVLSESFLAQVAERGSEAARFAFEDARVLFSRLPDLEDRLRAIVRYPVEGREERIRRFRAQFEAWHWYAHEGLKLGDRYLLGLGVARTVLFAARMILAHNERLFPYHKWLLEVLRAVPDRPADLLDRIDAVHRDPSQANLLGLWASVTNFRAWEGADEPWAARFMRDSELNWLDGEPPVEDL